MTDKAPLTIQSAFDKAVIHLRKQGRPAANEYGGCRYRMVSAQGAWDMCAVGCLIPDEEYKPEFENRALDNVIALTPSLAPLRALPADEGLRFLAHLQNAHDGWDEERSFEEGVLADLYEIAERFTLDTSILGKQS